MQSDRSNIDGNQAKTARATYLFANQLISKLSTNAYIEIRMAGLAMGDIWAVRQDKQDNNTTEDVCSFSFYEFRRFKLICQSFPSQILLRL
jgi:hypothetical protein